MTEIEKANLETTASVHSVKVFIEELKEYFAGVDHAEVVAMLEHMQQLAEAIDLGLISDEDLSIDNALLTEALESMSGSSVFDHAPEGMFDTDTDLGIFTLPEPQAPDAGNPLGGWEVYAQETDTGVTLADIGVKAAGGFLAKLVPGPVGFIVFQAGPVLTKGFVKTFVQPPDWTAEEAAKAVKKEEETARENGEGDATGPTEAGQSNEDGTTTGGRSLPEPQEGAATGPTEGGQSNEDGTTTGGRTLPDDNASETTMPQDPNMPEGGAFKLTEAQRAALEAKSREPGADPELILTDDDDRLIFVEYTLPNETDLDPLIIPDPDADAAMMATLDESRLDPTYGLIINEEAAGDGQALPDLSGNDDTVFFL
ncbi:MAG: hypothetical protein AAFP68_11785 [Pseudomonadota bacterium]